MSLDKGLRNKASGEHKTGPSGSPPPSSSPFFAYQSPRGRDVRYSILYPLAAILVNNVDTSGILVGRHVQHERRERSGRGKNICNTRIIACCILNIQQGGNHKR